MCWVVVRSVAAGLVCWVDLLEGKIVGWYAAGLELKMMGLVVGESWSGLVVGHVDNFLVGRVD